MCVYGGWGGACVCACVYVPRIVSSDKILHFKNTLLL